MVSNTATKKAIIEDLTENYLNKEIRIYIVGSPLPCRGTLKKIGKEILVIETDDNENSELRVIIGFITKFGS